MRYNIHTMGRKKEKPAESGSPTASPKTDVLTREQLVQQAFASVASALAGPEGFAPEQATQAVEQFFTTAYLTALSPTVTFSYLRTFSMITMVAARARGLEQTTAYAERLFKNYDEELQKLIAPTAPPQQPEPAVAMPTGANVDAAMTNVALALAGPEGFNPDGAKQTILQLQTTVYERTSSPPLVDLLYLKTFSMIAGTAAHMSSLGDATSYFSGLSQNYDVLIRNATSASASASQIPSPPPGPTTLPKG